MICRAVASRASCPSAMTRTTMSRSVTMPTSLWSSATGSAPMSSSRMRRAISGIRMSGSTTLTFSVITSCTRMSASIVNQCRDESVLGLSRFHTLVGGDLSDLGQVLFNCRQYFGCKRLRIGVFTPIDLLLQELDRFFVRLDLPLDVVLVEGVSRPGFQHLRLGLLHHTRPVRELHALRSGELLELLVRRRMVLDHHRGKVLDLLADGLLLRELCDGDFGHATLCQVFVEILVGVRVGERQRR